MEANTNNRTIYNPVQKDYVTFLKTSAETNGAFTLIECSVAPGGGVGLHYHKTYEETFEPLEGILSVECNGVTKQYGVGESVTAYRRMNHRFFNETEQECRFLCKMTPGQPGLEAALQIGYGLARDGKTNKGLPKDPQALAYLIQLSETNLPGWRSVFEWILRWQARSLSKKAGKKGCGIRMFRFDGWGCSILSPRCCLRPLYTDSVKIPRFVLPFYFFPLTFILTYGF